MIERGRVLGFRFDGREYQGHPGDTLASALLANGVRVVARSFKYHRPRGIMTAGIEEPSALVRLETGAFAEPNRRPTDILLYDGLRAASQHAWPGLRFDVAALAECFAPLLPAGFYYKTFMGPAQDRGARGWRSGSRCCAVWPGSGGRRNCRTRRATTSVTRIATCWWSAAGRPG